MTSIIKSTLIFCLAILFFSCSQNESQAGGTWDEAGNTISLLVNDTSGMPIANARINIVHLNEWQSKFSESKNLVSDSFKTDSFGKVTLKLNGVPARIEIEDSTKNTYRVGELLVIDSIDLTTMVLKNAKQIRGVLKDYNSAKKVSMALMGTSKIAQVDSVGNFTFDKVSNGEWTIAVNQENQVNYLNNSLIVNDTSVHIDTLDWIEKSEILMDDFSDDIPATRYYYNNAESWWFCSSDSVSHIFPSNLIEAQESLSDQKDFGEVIHLNYDVDDQTVGRYAICGFDINWSRIKDPAKARNDLSNLDSISFWAKGSGPIKLELISLFANHKDSSNHYTYDVQLNNQWQRHVISISSYGEKYGKETIQTMLKEITTIGFSQVQSVEFWLDQIILYGPKPSEIFKPQ